MAIDSVWPSKLAFTAQPIRTSKSFVPRDTFRQNPRRRNARHVHLAPLPIFLTRTVPLALLVPTKHYLVKITVWAVTPRSTVAPDRQILLSTAFVFVTARHRPWLLQTCQHPNLLLSHRVFLLYILHYLLRFSHRLRHLWNPRHHHPILHRYSLPRHHHSFHHKSQQLPFQHHWMLIMVSVRLTSKSFVEFVPTVPNSFNTFSFLY